MRNTFAMCLGKDECIDSSHLRITNLSVVGFNVSSLIAIGSSCF